MRFITLILLFFLTHLLYAQWETHYEKTNFKESPAYQETIKYSKKLAANSTSVNYIPFGVSPQHRELPLLIIDRDGYTDPDQVRAKGRVVILIEAGIHSGEIDGKEAGFLIYRDMIISGKNREWLDNITFLFIPIFNVDGHERSGPYNRINQNGPEEMGWRVTAQNLNLNRDFLKADTPEMQAWIELYHRWKPEFFVDIHVTDGADFQYPITYAVESNGNMAPPVTAWLKEQYVPVMEKKMFDRQFPTRVYVYFRKAHDVKSGMLSWAATPRFSQGYTALMNRPGLLIETHMLKDYKTRVDATRALLETTFEIIASDPRKLQSAIEESDRITSGKTFLDQPYTLKFTGTSDSIMVDFMGYEYTKEKSDLSGGWWYRYTKIPHVFKIPFFNRQVPLTTVKLPYAYLIPPEWKTVIERLKIHGVEMKKTTESQRAKVTVTKFNNVSFKNRPYEGHFQPKYDWSEKDSTIDLPKGTAIIPMKQIRAPLIAQTMEPQGGDSYVAWGFFNAIFEQKEYFESYVMEDMARIMFKEDPALEKIFLERLNNDSTFAASPRKILEWFYKRTPYFDQKQNQYPVVKVYNEEQLERLLEISED